MVENKIGMFFTVSAVCESNAEVWQDNEVFTGNYKKFLSNISQIKICKDLLLLETISLETFKSVDRIELEEYAFFISGKLARFASETNNELILNETRNYRKNLSNMNDLELLWVCSKLSNTCLSNISILENYGITSDSIADIQQLSSAFSIGVNRTKSSHSKTKSVRENIKKLVMDTEDLVKDKLDKNVEFFKNSNPEFYTQYQVARIIVDLESSGASETSKIAGMVN
jgi:hypothetical protein